MTYREMCRLLEEARMAAHKIKMLSLRVNETLQVNQRLTALYGTERVQSSGTYVNPALKALIAQDEKLAFFRSQLADAVDKQTEVQSFVLRMPDGDLRDLLLNFYCLGWGWERLSRVTHKSKRTLQRRMDIALQRLYEIKKKEDGL